MFRGHTRLQKHCEINPTNSVVSSNNKKHTDQPSKFKSWKQLENRHNITLSIHVFFQSLFKISLPYIAKGKHWLPPMVNFTQWVSYTTLIPLETNLEAERSSFCWIVFLLGSTKVENTKYWSLQIDCKLLDPNISFSSLFSWSRRSPSQERRIIPILRSWEGLV